jgi:hypothetical protein
MILLADKRTIEPALLSWNAREELMYKKKRNPLRLVLLVEAKGMLWSVDPGN